MGYPRQRRWRLIRLSARRSARSRRKASLSCRRWARSAITSGLWGPKRRLSLLSLSLSWRIADRSACASCLSSAWSARLPGRGSLCAGAFCAPRTAAQVPPVSAATATPLKIHRRTLLTMLSSVLVKHLW